MPLLAAAIPALIGVGTAIYSANQTSKANKKAVNDQKALINGLKYEPIDIEKLKADATRTAIENATQSLALERQLQPDVAATRTELSRQVSEDLKRGGNLSPDVVNRVETEGRVIGARSGIGSGGTVPLTASLLGLSSIDLINQRRGQAAGLLSQNDLPVTGLDPGAVASAEVANNAANNQFNLEKAGVNSNLINSEAAARTAQIGGQVGIVSSLAGLLGKGVGAYTGQTSNYGDLIKKVQPTLNQNPALNPLMTSSPLGLA